MSLLIHSILLRNCVCKFKFVIRTIYGSLYVLVMLLIVSLFVSRFASY